IFFFLSMDEFIQFHEQLIRPLRETLNTDGFLYNAWIIPAGIAVFIVGLAYIPFLLHLPLKTKVQFFLAGCLYVAGAIGMEAIGGYYYSTFLVPQDTSLDLAYLLITHIE